VTNCKPGSATPPLPGISAKIVDDDDDLGRAVEGAEQTTGYLVLDEPWPAMPRGIWGDAERFKETYWSRFAERQGWYIAGDGARYGTDGEIWVLGRIDDEMNVSGWRVPAERVQSVLESCSPMWGEKGR
jgi:acetyl-CoA synthetase